VNIELLTSHWLYTFLVVALTGAGGGRGRFYISDLDIDGLEVLLSGDVVVILGTGRCWSCIQYCGIGGGSCWLCWSRGDVLTSNCGCVGL